MNEHGTDDIVRLATAQNPIQAHIWEQALREAGIRSKVVGDFLDSGIGDISGLSPEIWVHKEDLAAAEDVLSRSQAASAGETPEEE